MDGVRCKCGGVLKMVMSLFGGMVRLHCTGCDTIEEMKEREYNRRVAEDADAQPETE